MLVTLLGIVTEVIEEQRKNALIGIAVTVLGITTTDWHVNEYCVGEAVGNTDGD